MITSFAKNVRLAITKVFVTVAINNLYNYLYDKINLSKSLLINNFLVLNN